MAKVTLRPPLQDLQAHGKLLGEEIGICSLSHQRLEQTITKQWWSAHPLSTPSEPTLMPTGHISGTYHMPDMS